MRARDLLLTLEDDPKLPLWQRVEHTLQTAILDGRLPSGMALPGSRVLAQVLDVHRQTVVVALKELEAQGWLVSVPFRGTYVADELPSMSRLKRPESAQPGPSVGFDLPSLFQSASLVSPDALLLADGAADPRLAPALELSRGYQRAMLRHSAALLQERDSCGTRFLREGVATWVSERHGIQIEPRRILITRGSRGALALLTNALFRQGDVAAVENPGNRGAWDIFRKGSRLGLRPVAVDSEGIIPTALESVLRKERIRMLYLTPRRQFPTGAAMSRQRGAEILDLARQYRVAVLEDDYDSEYTYSEQRMEPLMAHDVSGQVIHLGSLSRLLAPGLRLGYVVLPPSLVPFMERAKRDQEEQGDAALEWAVADLIRDGDLSRHLRKVRKIYQARRDHLVALLQQRLGAQLEVAAPGGGMGVWVKVKDGVDVEAWVRSARALGLVLNPPSHFFLEAPEPAFRIGFAQANDAELELAVERLVKALVVSA